VSLLCSQNYVTYDTAYIVIAPENVLSIGNQGKYSIYPNPASQKLTIEAPNDKRAATLTIYDLSGRVVLHQILKFENGAVSLPLLLRAGVYVAELMDDKGNKNIQRLSIL